MFYEKITKQDLDAMENEHGFTPNYDYDGYVLNRDSVTGEIVEEYYMNLTIYKTADEVYEEWLASKDKPTIQEPTVEDRLAEVELMNGNLLMEIAMMKGGM